MPTIRTSALFVLLTLTAACRGPSTMPSGMHIGGELQTRQSVRFSVVDAVPHEFFDQTPLSDDDAAHMEEEAGRKLDIAREGYEFNASAVLVMDERE